MQTISSHVTFEIGSGSLILCPDISACKTKIIIVKSLHPLKSAVRVAAQSLLIAAVLGVAPGCKDLPGQGGGKNGPLFSTYLVPVERFFPESIAFDFIKKDFYVGSVRNGEVQQGNVRNEKTLSYLPAGQDERAAATGIKLDVFGRLFIAGGATGKLFIYDAANKSLISKFNTQATNTFVNDIATTLTGDAYVTDSYNPVLYKVDKSSNGTLSLTNWLSFEGTVFQYQSGFNANGIVVTLDQRYLIIVQTNTGKLFRVSIQTKEVSEIQTGGANLTNGDGLLIDYNTLYVVRNANNAIVKLKLDDQFLNAVVTDTYKSEKFQFPTAIAKDGKDLLVVNSRLNLQNSTDPLILTPFTIDRIRF